MKDNQTESIKTFGISAAAFNETIGRLENYNHTYDYLISSIPDNSRVLDLACGPANISRYIARRKKIDITGYDLSPAMIELATKNLPQGTFKLQSIIDFKENNQYDLIINGFGLPYLDREQIEQSFRSTNAALKMDGIFYVSFMNGDHEGYETPSFNPDVRLYIRYHPADAIKALLVTCGLSPEKEWLLDYKEKDGSITTDVVIVARKK